MNNKETTNIPLKAKIEKAYNSRSYKNYFVSHGASSSRSFAVRSL